MKIELDNKLCEDYPLIFADRHADMKTTCMCWGFSCGDGWYTIINNLCWTIQSHIDSTNKQIESAKMWNQKVKDPTHDWQWDEAIIPRKTRKVPKQVPQVVATQVKEKFGTLRFYFSGGDDHIDGAVRMAEAMSSVTCDQCGKPAKLENTNNWLSTRCDEHRR